MKREPVEDVPHSVEAEHGFVEEHIRFVEVVSQILLLFCIT